MFKKIMLFLILTAGFAFGATTIDDATINGVAKHSWAKHKTEFPKIDNEVAFAKYIKNMVNVDKSTISKVRKVDGATVYWRDGVFCVLKNGVPNTGTCFKPTNGKKYYDMEAKK